LALDQLGVRNLIAAITIVIVLHEPVEAVKRILRKAGYSISVEQRMEYQCTRANSEDATYSFDVAFMEPETARKVNLDLGNAVRRTKVGPDYPASGIPLGTNLRWHSARNSLRLRGIGASTSFMGHFSVRNQLFTTKTIYIRWDMKAELARAEAVIRWIVGSAEGDQASAMPHDGLIGWRDAAGGRHVDAEAWSAKWGYKYRANAAAGRAAIATPRGVILLALGAPKVKIGREWLELPSLVIARKGRIQLPLKVALSFNP